MTPASIERGAAERVAAWFYTGPLGHLYGVLADLTQLWLRYAGRRLRGRLGALR